MTYLKFAKKIGYIREKTYLVNFLFEALFEHLVCFVENHSLNVGEVKVSALDMVQDTSAGTHKKVNSATQLVSLVLNGNTTIDCERFEFAWVVLQTSQFVLNLQG